MTAEPLSAAEAYQEFLDFDWSDQRWQTYLEGLYPPPNQRQLLKFKKKWYKRHVDADFDDTYEPSSASSTPTPSTSSSTPGNNRPSQTSMPLNFNGNNAFSDGSKWAVMGPKATTCFVAYAVALVVVMGAAAGVFPPYQALVVLVSAFILEILAKYGLKLNTQYLHTVLLDDVGVMPLMALTLLTPGLHPVIRILALVPGALTALLSFAQICKYHARLPASVRDFFSPLAEVNARFQVMQVRAHCEAALGFILVIGVFTATAAPISALLYWNFTMMRYMMSPFTQASFDKVDNVLAPFCGKIPGLKQGYAALKRFAYGFVDPESRRAGKLCTIL